MADLEVRVVSERRDGLLIELGHIVSKHQYTLLRQRMQRDDEGVSLTMHLRGPDGNRLALEEALAVHPRTLSFESEHGVPDAVVSSPAPQPPAARAAAHPAPKSGTRPAAKANQVEVERMLPSIAKDYPHVIPWVISLGKSVAADERAATLQLAGRRTGIWAYKRDYQLGAKLHLAEACKRIVAPAMKVLVPIMLDGTRVHVRDNQLCVPGQPSGCTFLKGFIEGLLEDSVEPSSVFVRIAGCRADGAAECMLDISH